MNSTTNDTRVLAITGGVGGAKLALGLKALLSPAQLAFLVNTGDDFTHLGLHISPDLDTLMYTLSGTNNPETGWGRMDESWHFIETFAALGGERWFNLGDRDLAVHVSRTERLRAGAPLSEVTRHLFAAHGVDYRVWPMSDSPVPTRVVTDRGTLAFQHYFVRDRCAPLVHRIEFVGATDAAAVPDVLEFLADPTLTGVIICPSNPFLSVDPVLAIPDIRRALDSCAAPVIAVSPLIAGAAVKGPTTKIMNELGLSESAATVAAHYGALLDGFILDEQDAALAADCAQHGARVITAQTLMASLDDRVKLAQTALDFLLTL